MAVLPDNVRIEFRPSHEIADCRWDEESQLYRVDVDGREYQSHHTSEQMREIAQSRRRTTAAFEAMARCAEARENRLKAEESNRARIQAEVMKEAGYFRVTEQGYRNLGTNNPNARRLVDLAVEARLKLERQATPQGAVIEFGRGRTLGPEGVDL